MIGYFILRMSFYSGAARGRSRDSKGALPILALGAGLAIVGFAGTFFGNLIKAAVSRQREFLPTPRRCSSPGIPGASRAR